MLANNIHFGMCLANVKTQILNVNVVTMKTALLNRIGEGI